MGGLIPNLPPQSLDEDLKNCLHSLRSDRLFRDLEDDDALKTFIYVRSASGTDSGNFSNQLLANSQTNFVILRKILWNS